MPACYLHAGRSTRREKVPACDLHAGRSMRMGMIPIGSADVVRGNSDLYLVSITLSEMPLGLTCSPCEWKLVVLNWCGSEWITGVGSRLGGRSLISCIRSTSPGFKRKVGPGMVPS